MVGGSKPLQNLRLTSRKVVSFGVVRLNVTFVATSVKKKFSNLQKGPFLAPQLLPERPIGRMTATPREQLRRAGDVANF